MNLCEAATEYVQTRGLARTPIYSACRFCGVLGPMEMQDVTQDAVNRFREQAGKTWSESTIRGTIKDVRTLAKCYCNRSITLTVRDATPDPQPTPLTTVDEVWKFAPLWLQQWIVVSYWTCTRLDDSLRLMIRIQSGEFAKRQHESLSWQANKTRHKHRVPVPDWLRRWLIPVDSVPFVRVNDHAQCLVRLNLAKCSQSASVDQVYPKHIRQRALTEWKRSSPDAGSIIHGSGLGVLDHYVPAIEILSSAIFRVRLPSCFGVTVSSGDELMSAWQRLDPSGQTLVRDMAVRMAVT